MSVLVVQILSIKNYPVIVVVLDCDAIHTNVSEKYRLLSPPSHLKMATYFFKTLVSTYYDL
jgi:hypothetical protein